MRRRPLVLVPLALLAALAAGAGMAQGGGPIEVPRMALPPAVVPPLPPPPAPVAKPPAPPVVMTTCDAAGCLASDGSRLQHFGTHLMGPRGVCSVQGVVLSCP